MARIFVFLTSLLAWSVLPLRAQEKKPETPAAASTLFGPRTVRVRTGTPQAPPPSQPKATPPAGEPPIEGEIIDR